MVPVIDAPDLPVHVRVLHVRLEPGDRPVTSWVLPHAPPHVHPDTKVAHRSDQLNEVAVRRLRGHGRTVSRRVPAEQQRELARACMCVTLRLR